MSLRRDLRRVHASTMPSKKLNLRDRVEDNQLDLSMSDLDEVPVREIAQIKMATFLDLSNNRLTSLGTNFASLTHLVKLDLSKNQLTELPSNFGDLVLLKHLDLYSNKIQHLPLSLGQLSNLRWLDLKDNPLVPVLAEVVGPCLDTAQCQKAARAVVPFMQVMKEKVDAEREFRSAQRKRQKEMDELAAREEKKKQQKQQKKNKKKAEKQQQKEKASKGENGVRHQAVADDVETVPPTDSRSSETSDIEVKFNTKPQGKASRVVSLVKLLVWIATLSFFGLTVLSLVDQRQYKKLQALVNRSVPSEALWNAVDVVAPKLAAAADGAQRCQRWLVSKETVGNLQAAWGDLQVKVVEWYRTLCDQVPQYYEVVRKKVAHYL